jgi:hypothetical protein
VGGVERIARRHDVSYISWAAPSQALVEAVGAVIVVGGASSGPEGTRAPEPPRSQLERRLRQARTLARRNPSRLWAAIRRDEQAQSLAASAEMIVAVDPQAILAVWHLARRYPRPSALLTLGAAEASLS